MEKKKWLGILCCCMIFNFSVCILFGMAKERKINGWLYDTTEKILSAYGEEQGETDILRKYGVEKSDFSPISMALEITGICLLNGILFFSVSWYDKKKQSEKLREMERYCEDILSNRETLQLHDNEEGEASILKNKVYDITMLLREKNAYLEESKCELEKFLADISHQLKTPITSLHMANELLRMDLPQEKKDLFLDNMQKDMMKIEWLVKGILNLAKLDSRTLTLKKEEILVKDLIAEVEDRFCALCEITGSIIEKNGKENSKAWCDFRWTKEGICNIVKNAIEHGATKVKISWEENYIYTKISIWDNGEGIDEEDLPHIFERFYKSKNAKEDSVGLGLAFTKSIVKHQGGDIEVHSEKQKGTEFVLKFFAVY